MKNFHLLRILLILFKVKLQTLIMKNALIISVFCFLFLNINGQDNTKMTNPVIEDILLGNYNPDDYQSANVINMPDEMVSLIQNELNPDSLYTYLLQLNGFYNRNTGSDTLSNLTGIGAARNWILKKFDEFDENAEDRLETGFLQFDMNICGMSRHKNVLAVLPGSSGNSEIIIIEGHMDSRCETACDIDCEARGMEDNGSGTALVMELARVMSKLTLDKTIVFMATTGEEQGLHGAEAMAFYCKFTHPEIDVKAVLNNDVIGGIICGETSSEPSCPGENLIDSTQVRLFSKGAFDSPHKSLARYIKLQYQQELMPIVNVPMMLTIMSAEDRTGRGGDHIPFAAKNLPAMRFTSAHEHGDAGIDEDYHDRQHTTKDILGVDTNGDEIIDSFYVDFNYLARNARINGVAASMISQSPKTIDFSAEWIDSQINVSILDDNEYMNYVIGVRTTNNDFDTLIYFQDSKDFSFSPDTEEDIIFLSVASVDDNEIESCFSDEQFVQQTVGTNELTFVKKYPIELWQNRPNPFDEATTITIYSEKEFDYGSANLVISSTSGKIIKTWSVDINPGINEYLYNHGYGVAGTHNYSLIIDGLLVDTKRMIFAN